MSDLHTSNDGFNTLDLGLQPYLSDIPISDNLQQTLDRLMAFDVNNKTWRTLKSDSDGRLFVTTAPTQTSTAPQSNPTVGVAQSAILSANPSRKLMMIQNLGSAAIYVGFGNNITTATGFQIAPQQTFIDDHFLGIVNAISGSAGQDVRIVEF